MPDLQVLQNLTLLDNIWICVCIQHQETDKGVVAYMQLPRNILWKLAQNKRNSINSVLASSRSVEMSDAKGIMGRESTFIKQCKQRKSQVWRQFRFQSRQGQKFLFGFMLPNFRPDNEFSSRVY